MSKKEGPNTVHIHHHYASKPKPIKRARANRPTKKRIPLTRYISVAAKVFEQLMRIIK